MVLSVSFRLQFLFLWHSFLHVQLEFKPMLTTIPGRRSSVRKSLILGLGLVTFTLAAAVTAAWAADGRNPFAGDPKAAKAGESEFRINCALCHGLGARGGGRGPDLTRARKKHVHSDAEM